jgi:hypothetical protein
VTDPVHYASQPDAKPRFEQSIAQLEIFAERAVLP